MKRQTDLFGFFRPVDKESTAKSSSTCTTPTATPSKPDYHSNVDGVSIILDTPNASQAPSDNEILLSPSTVPFNQSPLSIVKPMLNSQASTRERRRPVHKRSSLTVRLQSELLEKRSKLLAFDGGFPDESNLERANRQANASAKIRRGNYDALNYAPMDQVQINCLPSINQSISMGNKNFSRRSKLLVKKALGSAPLARRPLSDLVDEPESGEHLEQQSKCMQDSQLRLLQSGTDTKKLYNTKNKQASSSPLTAASLDSEETDALNDIIDLLEHSPAQRKLPLQLTSRKLVRKSSMSSRKVPPSVVLTGADESISAIETKTQNPTLRESGTNPILNDSFNQLNLSDWSSNGDLPEVNTSAEMKVRPPENHLLPSARFYRGRVTKLTRLSDRILLSLDLDSYDRHTVKPEFANNSLQVVLTDSWVDTQVQLGDTVHLVPGVGCSIVDEGQITVSDGAGTPETVLSGFGKHVPSALIQHPDLLIAGTKLVGSFYCMRRSILEQFWPSGDDSSSCPSQSAQKGDAPIQHSSGYVMLMGSLLHELFQKLITSPKPNIEEGGTIITSLLTRADIILQAYACHTTMEELRTALSEHLNAICQWISIHCSHDRLPNQSFSRRPLVYKVMDVEENIWSTRFGIKGKIDLSLLCRAPDSFLSTKEQFPPREDPKCLSLIPMELKTGRPTYSVEHKGQVLLYLLMLFDRYGLTYDALKDRDIQIAQFGWLVYLRDTSSFSGSNPGLIEPNVFSFRGLLQTRNRIATALVQLTQVDTTDDDPNASPSPAWTPKLPSPINRLHTCQSCPVQLACSLLQRDEDDRSGCAATISLDSNPPITTVPQLLSIKRSHLTADHLAFFLHWSRLVLMEYADSDKLENVVGRIVTGRSREQSSINHVSSPVHRLRVHSATCNATNGQWTTVLVPNNELVDGDGSVNLSEQAPASGELVIVSSSDCVHVGITLGTVLPSIPISETFNSKEVAAKEEPTKLVLSTDRPLPTWIDEFRLDRYVTPKCTQLNLSNLVGLMQDSDLSRYLRKLIIDRVRPSFNSTLSKRVVQDIRNILKPMNACQRTAILRVLMANDYVLIQGYPGTGKTQTLTALLRVLALLNRKILVVSHTHSAVDNLLGRLVEFGEKRILRLGSPDRIRHDLLEYCFEHILTQSSLKCDTIDPVYQCQKLIDNAVVVGCSALAASGGADLRHVALSGCKFDLVLIDEATQLLLPTSLGPLLCLRSTSNGFGARFVLVGDTYQLPPLVQSSRARKAGFECSLFSYLLKDNDHLSGPRHTETLDPVLSTYGCTSKASSFNHDRPCLVELNVQYRMNDSILILANKLTYKNAMRAANVEIAKATLADVLQPDVQHSTSIQNVPWVKRVFSPLLSDTVLFLDTHLWNCCSPVSSSGSHLQNHTEALLVLFIVSGLVHRGVRQPDIGVIAPHRKQVALIKRLLAGSDDTGRVDSVEVNTVDQFQGRDKRVIILSLTVCSGSPTSLDSCDPIERRSGLLETIPRLTVALTRAKHKLIIVGCPGGCNYSQPSYSTDCTQRRALGALGNLFVLLHQVSAIETLPVEDRSIMCAR